jgi:hypothetical protein
MDDDDAPVTPLPAWRIFGTSQTSRLMGRRRRSFYAGWPRAMSAVTVAKEIFGG